MTTTNIAEVLKLAAKPIQYDNDEKTWLEFRFKLDLVDERYVALLLDAESQLVANLPTGTEESAVTIRTLSHTLYALLKTLTTHEEATLHVKELDIFLSMKVLEITPAVLSLGKLCDENGYSYEWINGQKPHLIKTVIENNVTRRTSLRSWFQDCQQILHPVLILQHQMTPLTQENDHPTSSLERLLHQPQLCQATVRLEKEKI